MAEEQSQERTEEATPRRKQQAREKGQVAHSRELNTMIMLLFSSVAVSILGPHIIDRIMTMTKWNFTLSKQNIFDTSTMMIYLKTSLLEAVSALAPFFVLVMIAAVAGPLLMGGVTFSTKSLTFKWDKLDPISGLKRVFAVRGLVELLKALVKFLIIGTVAVFFLYQQFDDYIGLGNEPVDTALPHAVNLLVWALITISSALILIALVDVPFQIWDHNKNLKMTFQEIKDENKDTEGSPDVRGRVRRVQREIAQRRMMAEVPKADVIVTNPEHYSVALRYNQKTMGAPVVVAKGLDLVAMQIRRIANEHNVVLLEAPPLARSIYHTTELNQEIPAGLYMAVAQVLAYVFQLKRSRKPYSGTQAMNDISIPEDLRYDK